MDDPKRHVVEDYPVEKLPDELRGTLDPGGSARVIVEDSTTLKRATPDRFLRHFGSAQHKNTSVQEAVERVRALRDEWAE